MVAAVAATFMLSGCGVHGLDFVKDERVDIVAPVDRSKVTLPVHVRWSAHGVDVGPDAGAFGVFVDRAPPPPGQSLSWPFRNDIACKAADGRRLCASQTFLAGRGVHRVTATAFRVDHVSRLTGNDRSRQFHEVTVVLLDGHGRRRGEGAWSVEFEVRS